MTTVCSEPIGVIFLESRMVDMEQRFILIEKDVSDVKKDITEMNTRLAIAEAGLKDVKEDIRSIKDDTKWLRRSITNALIVALVGGAVAIFYAAIKLNQ